MTPASISRHYAEDHQQLDALFHHFRKKAVERREKDLLLLQTRFQIQERFLRARRIAGFRVLPMIDQVVGQEEGAEIFAAMDNTLRPVSVPRRTSDMVPRG